jgi:DNA-binding transcriptional LysR family regulator
MEIRQLEAFAAVYSAGSVTAAGRLLDRSQPMVSRQIQDLEQELGFTLFARTRPMVTLTEQGRQFYDEVRNVLAGLNQLDARAREISRGQSRPLRIAATPSLGASLLPTVIGQLEARAPVFERQMYIDTMQPDQVVRIITEGKADIGLITLPMDLDRCRLLWSGQAPCVLAIPAGHPLARCEVVELGNLGDTVVITMSNRSGLRHRLSTALLQAPTAGRTRRHIEATSYLNALMFVRAGVGVALMDPFTVMHVPIDGVVYRPIDAHLPYMIGAIGHHDRILPDEGQRLVQALWNYSIDTIPRFMPGDPSGLPVISDPIESGPASNEDVA